MAEEKSPPIDPEEVARKVAEFERALEEATSPLHYGFTPSAEQFARDKAEYLKQLRGKETPMSRKYEFVKGSLCNGENAGCGCVEVATNLIDEPGGMVAVRDTKSGRVLEFDRHEWEGFLRSAKNDEFDI